MILFLFLLFSLPSHSLRATRFIAGQHKRASTQGIPARHTAQRIQVLRCAGLMARICAGKALHAPLVVNHSGIHKATGFACTFRSKAFKMLRITVHVACVRKPSRALPVRTCKRPRRRRSRCASSKADRCKQSQNQSRFPVLHRWPPSEIQLFLLQMPVIENCAETPSPAFVFTIPRVSACVNFRFYMIRLFTLS